jgi:hypothetical protein
MKFVYSNASEILPVNDPGGATVKDVDGETSDVGDVISV